MATARLDRLESLIGGSGTAELLKIQRLLDSRLKNLEDAAPTSALKIFAIPELFEMIMLMLPMQQIYSAQRVCHDFRARLLLSGRLRQAMFLEFRDNDNPKVFQQALVNPQANYGILSATGFCSKANIDPSRNVLELRLEADLELNHGELVLHLIPGFLDGSWERMNIASTNIPVHVRLVCYSEAFQPVLHRTHCLRDGHRTFGDLCDLADSILKESVGILNKRR